MTEKEEENLRAGKGSINGNAVNWLRRIPLQNKGSEGKESYNRGSNGPECRKESNIMKR